MSETKKGATEAEEAYGVPAPAATTNSAQEESVQAILDDPDTENWLTKAKRPAKAQNTQYLEETNEQSASPQRSPENKSHILSYLEDAPDEVNQQLPSYGGRLGRPRPENSLDHNTPHRLQRQQPVHANESVPGAFAAAPGSELQQRQLPDYSAAVVAAAADPEEIGMGTPAAGENDGLAVANPVQSQILDRAQEVNLERNTEAKKKFWVWLMVGFCLALAVIVGSIVGISAKDSNMELAPTLAPLVAPSESPTIAPSGPLDLLLESLPGVTVAWLERNATDQRKALAWLENHPDLASMTEGRKKQLFALATIYYSMGGETWPANIKEDWLQYGKEECFWFPLPFVVAEPNGECQASDSFARCNNDCEFQRLSFEASTERAELPPAIALLTSLSSFSSRHNNIKTLLARFLPIEFYQLKNFTSLSLYGNYLAGSIPSEFGLMAGMQNLLLDSNDLSGPIPPELGMMTSLLALRLGLNHLTGTIPGELGLMTDMHVLAMDHNDLSGPIPAELGMMTNLTRLQLESNRLTGTIPGDFGSMTSLRFLALYNNTLVGHIPSELGLLTGMQHFQLSKNQLTGLIPSQLSHMTGLTLLSLEMNGLSGSLSSELGLLSQLERAGLNNNALTGTIPPELGKLAVNGSLRVLFLNDNLLSGSIPESLCSLGLYHERMDLGLSFDCSGMLCGCCWCPCSGSNYTAECQALPYIPSRDDEDWPGEFPSEANAIAINIHTDDSPHQTGFWWGVEDVPGVWKTLEFKHYVVRANSIHSYTKLVDPGALYRVQIIDSRGDGTCCAGGLGWFTITNSTPSSEYKEGSVIWEATGDFLEESLDVYIRTDSNGNAQQVTYTPLD